MKAQVTSLLVCWTAPLAGGGWAITDYVTEMSTDGENCSTFGDGVSTGTSTKVTGLAGKTIHCVRIAAVSDVGTGAWLTTTATTK